MNPAAPEPGESLIASEGGTPLWYCGACGRLITPAAAKTLRPDDKHLCPKCAESHPGRSGKAPPRSGKNTAAAEPRPSKASLAPAQPRPSSASLKPPAREVAHRLPAAPTAVARRSSTPILLFAGGGAAVVLLGLIALVLAWSSPQEPEPSREPVQIADVPEPERPAEPGGPDGKEAAAVQPPVKPEPSAVAPPVPPDGGAGERKDAPRPPEPPTKPVATAAETLKAFEKDLAAAGELVKGEKFSAALDLLRALKERAADAPWWEERRQAWADAERQAREQLKEYTQEAEAACAEAGKTDKLEALTQIEAVWKPRTAGVLPLDAWVLLNAVSCRAEKGTVLRKQADGSILASGPNPDRDTYTVEAETRLPAITAFRLEALPDPSLPNGGPGRPQGNGNIVLTDIAVHAAPPGGGASKPVVLARARADFAQNEFPVEAAIDGNANSGWALNPRLGRPHTAVLELASPLAEPGGVRLTFTLGFQSQFPGHNLGRFRLSATAAKTIPAPAPEAPVAAAEAVTDVLGFEPAQRVLKAVAAARSGLLARARKKREAEIEAKLDALEQACRPKPRQIEANTRSLEEIESQATQDAESAAKYAERLGNLRFEIETVRQGELAVYRTVTRAAGGGGEAQFDFSTPEQFGVWTFDNPGNCGSAQLDSRRHAVVLRTTGKHNWDGRERRNVPVLRLPFYFRADRWVIEVETEPLSDANKPIKPEAGVLVWDGGGTVLHLIAREVPNKGYHVFLGGSTPKREQPWNRFVNVPGRPKEPVRLQMVCALGVVSCNAATSLGSVYIGKETLGFEPGYTGAFIRTDEDNEDAQAAFRSFKIVGVPHSEKLKELREKERPAALKASAAALQRQAAAVRLANEGALVPLSLEKAATIASTKCLFLGRGEEDRLVLPRWGLLYANGIPFVVADPKGDTVSNAILLQGPEGKAAAAMPRSVTVPCGVSAGTIHLLSGISGGGWPAGEKGSRTLLVRLRYEDGTSEEHAFLNGVHFADFSRLVEVPGSTLAFRAREQQVRYLPVFPKRPQAIIKEIEFAKGEDKTAPLVLAATADKRLPLPKVYNPGLEGKTLVEGKFGKALKCSDREQDCVRVGHYDELDPPQLTLMAWLWLDEFPGGDARHWLVAKNENETKPGHYGLLCDGDSVGAYLRAGREVHVKADRPKLRLKEWQHLAMTYDGAELKLYLNGAAVGLWSAGGPRETGTREFSIGMRPDGFQPFKALVDEVRVYNRAVPPEEMRLHLGDPGCTPREGLSAYWGFDDAP